MTKTRLYSLLLLLSCSLFAYSQSSPVGNWLIYIGNKKVKKDSKWSIHHEVQHRNYNAIGDLEQLLLRTGVGYDILPNTNVLLGYGFIHSQNYIDNTDDKVEVNEHRIFQQFITKQKLGRIAVQHRYRFEQRWVEDNDLRLRLRYFLALNLPINNSEMIEKTWYASAYNEIFIKNDQGFFDRNRLYGGLGYKLNKTCRFELGYMTQFLRARNRSQVNLIAFVNF